MKMDLVMYPFEDWNVQNLVEPTSFIRSTGNSFFEINAVGPLSPAAEISRATVAIISSSGSGTRARGQNGVVIKYSG
jgi:hypothetical protein